MSIKSNIKEFFKTESQKKKETKDEAQFQLYSGKKALKSEIKRLEKERKGLVLKYRSLREGTQEYHDTIKAFQNTEKSLKDCEDGLAIIEKTKNDLVSGAKTGSKSLNVGDTVSNAMKNILTVISSEDSAAVMTTEERNRVSYEIEKAYDSRLPENTLDDWREMSDECTSEEIISEDEYDEETIDKMDAMLSEMNKESRRKASKRENLLDKEIDDELLQVRSNLEKLKSEAVN